MAALFQPADNSEHATPRELGSFNEETLDQSCDVILVVEDGKEFKAHKRVLSEASPFFEKMLRSDMKESKEGMVRLEMFSESAMRNALAFIYTGSVQILAEHNARDLIVIADYLFLENLKTLGEGVLVQKLNTSNCIPTYYFSQRYRCEGLFSKSKTFILANFTAVYEANCEEVLNMSSKEIEMLISSDEIDVSAEEDVFRIILAWIGHEKSKRKKYFAELFRQVRLVYVSRDFLCSDIVTNDLVKDTEGCLDLVEDAMRLIDSKDFGNLSPRKSLETPVILSCTIKFNSRDRSRVTIQCYFPRDDRWCSLGEIGPDPYVEVGNSVSCRGKLYSFPLPVLDIVTSYNLYSHCRMLLPLKRDREFREIFASNEGEMYVLMSERCYSCDDFPFFQLRSTVGDPYGKRLFDIRYFHRGTHICYIMKYKPESDSWDDIPLFDNLDLRQDSCIVAKDNFIYFIGGVKFFEEGLHECKFLTDVQRYDLSRNQWDKVADIQEPKMSPCGAVVNGKIFIAGRKAPGRNITQFKEMPVTCQCEVYNETTNEWQFIASFNIIPDACPKFLSVDGTLYALGIMVRERGYCSPDLRVQCYDPDKNEWNRKTEIPFREPEFPDILVSANAYSEKIFKGFLDHELFEVMGVEPLTEVPAPAPAKTTKRKCLIM